MSKKKVITLLLTLAMILSLSVGVSAAETTEAKVPSRRFRVRFPPRCRFHWWMAMWSAPTTLQSPITPRQEVLR